MGFSLGAVAFLGIAIAGAARAQDTCFIDFHRGFVGEWTRTFIQRSDGPGFGFETETEHQRTRWVEPATKITESGASWDAAPSRTYRQEFTDSSIRHTDMVAGESPREVLIENIRSACHATEDGALVLVLHFSRQRNGVMTEFRNTAEVRENSNVVVSQMRPAGSEEPYQWHNTVLGVRRAE